MSAKNELRFTDTNAASDSKGRTWGLEGGLFWWLIGGIGAGIIVFFVLLVVLNESLTMSFVAALVPVSLCLAYLMIGLPVLAADTDEQAEHLATSTQQRGLRLIRGQPIFTPPPVPSMDRLWNAGEKRAVEGRLAAAVIGGPVTVERKLKEFLELTQANELILFSDFYRLEDRLRSYEIVAGLFLKPTK